MCIPRMARKLFKIKENLEKKKLFIRMEYHSEISTLQRDFCCENSNKRNYSLYLFAPKSKFRVTLETKSKIQNK